MPQEWIEYENRIKTQGWPTIDDTKTFLSSYEFYKITVLFEQNQTFTHSLDHQMTADGEQKFRLVSLAKNIIFSNEFQLILLYKTFQKHI